MSIRQFKSTDVKIITKQNAYDGFFKIEKYTVQHRCFAGGWTEPFDREIFARGDSTAVLLCDPSKEKVVIIEQFRVAAMQDHHSPWLLEIVAGAIDTDETPEAVITREAKEEANCHIQKLIPICKFYCSPGGTSERVHLYCGIIDSTTISNSICGLPDEHEDILVHLLPYKTAFELLNSGQINTAVAIIALQWLMLKGP